ncbi:GcrA cell cycle regulator [Rhizobiales bacterium]|uniref:GcrA family cell cycle regulator n=1 Tax=Hongsoonwoonella zoysiae TaxID=2821844 RepID=UPI0015614942|nr:GcrA family cell cycle regulator [Hongsoonwoonella zoysiae]NRG19913.1 GcrA cell cycle regulator [Hongsoonwoonella zoysiae]
MVWTPEREDLLKKLWLQGLSASQIARTMDCFTRNAIIGKAHRLNLPKRSPVTRSSPKPRRLRAKPTLARIGSMTKAGPRLPAQHREVGLSAGRALDCEAFMPQSGGGIALTETHTILMELKHNTCKWPIGDPGDPEFHFCSLNVDSGKSYCEFHHRLAYRPLRGRKERRESRLEEQEFVKAMAS